MVPVATASEAVEVLHRDDAEEAAALTVGGRTKAGTNADDRTTEQNAAVKRLRERSVNMVVRGALLLCLVLH